LIKPSFGSGAGIALKIARPATIGGMYIKNLVTVYPPFSVHYSPPPFVNLFFFPDKLLYSALGRGIEFVMIGSDQLDIEDAGAGSNRAGGAAPISSMITVL
jgi:hypothetical protein